MSSARRDDNSDDEGSQGSGEAAAQVPGRRRMSLRAWFRAARAAVQEDRRGSGGRLSGALKRLSAGTRTSGAGESAAGRARRPSKFKRGMARRHRPKKEVFDQWQELQRVQEAVRYYPTPLPNDVKFIRFKGREPKLRARMLHGESLAHPDADLEPESDTVRVFVSGTFQDFRFERDTIMGLLAPRLRSYCRQHGLEFRMSDLRTALSDRVHDSRAVSMRELRRCKSESVALNVIALVGNRYGYCPFPTTIDAALFEHLRDEARRDGEGAQLLLDKWFVRDMNTVPASFVLQPVESVAWASPTTHMDAFDAEWRYAFRQLQTCLRNAALRCEADGELSHEEAKPFWQSVVEEELDLGVLDAHDRHRVYVWQRELVADAADDADKLALPHYFDEPAPPEAAAGPREEEDTLARAEAEQQHAWLSDLKARLESAVPVAQRTVSEVPLEGGLDPVGVDAHRVYLYSLLTSLDKAVRGSIKHELVNGRFRRDPVFEEARLQLQWAAGRAEGFCGRADLVQRVRRCPERLVMVHGIVGSGKTSVLARVCADVAAAKASGKSDTVLICRFVGISARSADTPNLLRSVYEQLAETYASAAPIPSGAPMLKRALNTFLGLATEERPLVLVLDGVDQLEDGDDSWLPAAEKLLPPHVRLIFSCRDGSATARKFNRLAVGAHNHSQKRLVAMRRGKSDDDLASEANNVVDPDTGRTPFARLSTPSFQPAEADVMLDAWLNTAQRALQPRQRALVISTCMGLRDPGPLALWLLTQEALRWASYDPVPAEAWAAAKEMDDVMSLVLARLEQDHGAVIVGAALALVTGSAEGLREGELEDLLSLHDEALAEVFNRTQFVPPLARFPQRVLTKLLADLAPYTYRGNWAHREFRRTSLQRYSGRMHASYRLLAEYFGATDASQLARPAFRAEVAGQSWLLAPNRFPQPQPFRFDTGNINIRKLVELPQALSNAGDQDALEALVCDLDFIRCTLEALPDDLGYWLGETQTFRTAKVAQAVARGRSAYDRTPADIEEILWIRLATTLPEDDPLLQRLQMERMQKHGLHATQPVRLAPRHATADLAAGPAGASGSAPAGGLGSLRGHRGGVTAISLYDDPITKETFLCSASDESVRVWSLAGRELVHALPRPELSAAAAASTGGRSRKHKPRRSRAADEPLPAAQVLQAFVEPDGGAVRLVAGTGPHLVVYAVTAGVVLRVLEHAHELAVSAVSVLYESSGEVRIVSGSEDGAIKMWNGASGKRLGTISARNGPVLQLDPFVDPGSGEWLILGVHAHGIHVYVVDGDSRPVQTLAVAGEAFTDAVTFEHDAQVFALSCSAAQCTLRVWDLASGAQVRVLDSEQDWNGPFACVDVFNDAATGAVRCVTGDAQGEVKVWDPVTGALLQSLRHTGDRPGPVDAPAVLDVTAFVTPELELVIVSAASDGAVALSPGVEAVAAGAADASDGAPSVIAAASRFARGPARGMHCYGTARGWRVVAAHGTGLFVVDPTSRRVEASWIGNSPINDISVYDTPRVDVVRCAAALQSGQLVVWQVHAPDAPPLTVQAHKGPALSCIAFDPRNGGADVFVASGGSDGGVLVTNIATGAKLHQWAAHAGSPVAFLAAAHDKAGAFTLITGTRDSVRRWPFAKIARAAAATLPMNRKLVADELPAEPPVLAVAAYTALKAQSPRVLVSAANGLVRVVEVATGGERVLRGHTGDVRVMRSFADPVSGKQIIVTAAHDNTVRLWEQDTAAPLATYDFGQEVSALATYRVPGSPGAVVIVAALTQELAVLAYISDA